jgi:hypothetical protein
LVEPCLLRGEPVTLALLELGQWQMRQRCWNRVGLSGSRDRLGSRPEAGVASVGHVPQGVAHVCEQVPAIGDLGSLGRTLPGAVGVDAGAVTGDHLDAWVTLKPAGQGRGRAVWQEVDDTVLLQVAEDGAVALPAPPCPIIHAQHAGWRDRLGAGRPHKA